MRLRTYVCISPPLLIFSGHANDLVFGYCVDLVCPYVHVLQTCLSVLSCRDNFTVCVNEPAHQRYVKINSLKLVVAIVVLVKATHSSADARIPTCTCTCRS